MVPHKQSTEKLNLGPEPSTLKISKKIQYRYIESNMRLSSKKIKGAGLKEGDLLDNAKGNCV